MRHGINKIKVRNPWVGVIAAILLSVIILSTSEVFAESMTVTADDLPGSSGVTIYPRSFEFDWTAMSTDFSPKKFQATLDVATFTTVEIMKVDLNVVSPEAAGWKLQFIDSSSVVISETCLDSAVGLKTATFTGLSVTYSNVDKLKVLFIPAC